MTCGKEAPVVLASQNGDIRIQACSLTGKGLIYAPNGTVTINVDRFNFTGTIIAKRVNIQASYPTQTLLKDPNEPQD